MLEERVKAFIKKYNLSGKFLVAFSGGFDSMCLLDILHKEKFDIAAIHLNHNWRGDESSQEEENCRSFALQRGIDFYSETLPENIAHTEIAAREARYKFFEKCSKIFNSNIVFTAHNYNDNAETVLYRIIKGTGTIGLRGISEHRNIYYRPLLNTTRDEIEKYCYQNSLKPNTDSSNNNTKYKRNLIRKEILPLMKQINPNVIDAINSLSEIAQEDGEFSNSQKYFVRQLLIDNNINYDRKKIEDISNFIEKNKTSKSGKTMSLTNNLQLFVNDKNIKTIKKVTKPDIEVKVYAEGEYKINDKIFSVKKCNENIENYPDDNEYRAYISVNDVDFTIRYRNDGDYIQPLGCMGKQKLKKYLNEKKIPNHEKDHIVLLCKGKEVLWVSGYGISDKVKVTNKATHVIELRGK